MGVIEDVASIKKELEEIKDENLKKNIKIQELNKIKKANRMLLEALSIAIIAFIFLLAYAIFIVNCWQMWFR